ncbi:MAG: glycosyltransferase family 2 protein [Planctomycetota bacterium]|nr:glycosyltransferase family 2 protein [Planctomycetota bacterium]
MKVCAIIPAFNEASRIAGVVGGVQDRGVTPVVIDDGSADTTADAARREGAVVLRHSSNLGKGVALMTGFKHALDRGLDAVITLDGDGQHDPAEIPKFISHAERGGDDMVLGSRMGDVVSMPLIRKWTNQATSAVVSRLAHARIMDSQSGYRLIRTRVLRAVDLVSLRYDLESEILIQAARRGFRISEIPVRTIYEGSTSDIRPGLDALRFIRLVLRLAWTGKRGSRSDVHCHAG